MRKTVLVPFVAVLVCAAAASAVAQAPSDSWQVKVVPYFKYDALTQGPVMGFAFRF